MPPEWGGALKVAQVALGGCRLHQQEPRLYSITSMNHQIDDHNTAALSRNPTSAFKIETRVRDRINNEVQCRNACARDRRQVKGARVLVLLVLVAN